MIVTVNARERVEMRRVSLDGTLLDTIPMPATMRISSEIASNALAPDGRIGVRLIPPDSWFWPAAIFDPRTGSLEVVPSDRNADMLAPGWTADGKLVTVASYARVPIWRFRQVSGASQSSPSSR
jgi:hypothetical protein